MVKLSFLATLLGVTAVTFLCSTVEARRRHPEETSASTHQQRRLTEDDSDAVPSGKVSGLINKVSVRGSRSLAGTNVKVPVPEGPDDHLVTDLPLLDNNDFKPKR